MTHVTASGKTIGREIRASYSLEYEGRAGSTGKVNFHLATSTFALFVNSLLLFLLTLRMYRLVDGAGRDIKAIANVVARQRARYEY